MKKFIALFASTILILLSCDDWSGVESLESGGSAADIAGQWYMEDMDNSMISMFAEYTFMPFGGDVYANEYWKVNGFKKSTPKVAYSVDNNSIAMYIGSGKYDIELRGNALTMKAEQITQDEVIRPLHMQFMRIVGTLSLDVDSVIRLDSLQQIIEAYTAKPIVVTSYTITDDAIASVDETGLLTAKLAGTTYLKAETDDGIAVLKISVIDKNNPWHDFSRGLGKSFDEVKQLWGKRFYTSGNSSDSIRYYYDNDHVDRVDIYQHDNIADSIVVIFEKELPDTLIMNYLKKRTAFVKDSIKNGSLFFRWYTDNKKNYLLSTYSAKYHPSQKKLVYTAFDPDWDDRSNDYGLSFEELKNKYGKYRSYSPFTSFGKQVIYKNVKNDFISSITYYLNPNVYMYNITVNLDIPIDMLKDYLTKRFLYMNSSFPYIRNVQKDGKELYLWVSVSERNGHSLSYHFEENE